MMDVSCWPEVTCRRVRSSAVAVARCQQALLPERGTARAAGGGLQQHNFSRLLEGNNFSEPKGLLAALPFFTSVVTGMVLLARGEEEFTSLPRSYCRKRLCVWLWL